MRVLYSKAPRRYNVRSLACVTDDAGRPGILRRGRKTEARRRDTGRPMNICFQADADFNKDILCSSPAPSDNADGLTSHSSRTDVRVRFMPDLEPQIESNNPEV